MKIESAILHWLIENFIYLIIIFSGFLLKYNLNKKNTNKDSLKKINNYASIFAAIFLILEILLEKIIEEKFGIPHNIINIITLLFILTILIDVLVHLNTLFNNIEDSLNKIDNFANKIQSHPIIATKNDFSNIVNRLFDELTGVRSVAINFAQESLKEISEKAFIKVDITFADYTNKILELLNKSEKSVIGTYTIRPKVIYDILTDTNPQNKQKKDDTEKYIKKFNSLPITTKRFVVLEIDEIIGILKDAYSNMVNNGNSNINFDDIPEIKWFNDNLSCNTGVYWSVTPIFLENFKLHNLDGHINSIVSPGSGQHYMTDFVIFDEQLLLIWRENHEKIINNANEMSGTLFMSWSKSIDSISKVLNEISTKNGIFNSFDELIRYLSTMKKNKFATYNLNNNDEMNKLQNLYNQIINSKNSFNTNSFNQAIFKCN